MSTGKERLYSWGENTIRWYSNAISFRSFHSEVAKFMLEDLPSSPSVVDVGCGIGALVMHLAPHCGRLAAMDLNPAAIAYLRRQLNRRGLSRVETFADDFLSAAPPENKFDGAVFCLAGGVDIFLDTGFQWADTLFFVENATNQRSFSSVGVQTKETYFNDDLNRLQELGIPHSYRFFTAPFGQVFTDRSDAEAFMRHYNPDESEASVQASLNARLQPLDHPVFKFFIPNEKPLLMITVHRP